jgi:hypothetical protein
LDRAAKQQQYLGQRHLAGVHVRNDRKGPPRKISSVRVLIDTADLPVLMDRR